MFSLSLSLPYLNNTPPALSVYSHPSRVCACVRANNTSFVLYLGHAHSRAEVTRDIARQQQGILYSIHVYYT